MKYSEVLEKMVEGDMCGLVDASEEWGRSPRRVPCSAIFRGCDDGGVFYIAIDRWCTGHAHFWLHDPSTDSWDSVSAGARVGWFT